MLAFKAIDLARLEEYTKKKDTHPYTVKKCYNFYMASVKLDELKKAGYVSALRAAHIDRFE